MDMVEEAKGGDELHAGAALEIGKRTRVATDSDEEARSEHLAVLELEGVSGSKQVCSDNDGIDAIEQTDLKEAALMNGESREGDRMNTKDCEKCTEEEAGEAASTIEQCTTCTAIDAREGAEAQMVEDHPGPAMGGESESDSAADGDEEKENNAFVSGKDFIELEGDGGSGDETGGEGVDDHEKFGVSERDSYIAHFRCLLGLEWLTEEDHVKERLQRPLQQLEEEGLACSGLWAEQRPFQSLALSRARGIPYLSEVSVGRTVLLTADKAKVQMKDPNVTVFGEIFGISSKEIIVTCGARFRGALRLDLGPNRIAQSRLNEVLNVLERGGGPHPWAHGLGLLSPCTPLATAIFASIGERHRGVTPPDLQTDGHSRGDTTDEGIDGTLGACHTAKTSGSIAEMARAKHVVVPPPRWVSYPSGMYRTTNQKLSCQLKKTPRMRLNPSQ